MAIEDLPSLRPALETASETGSDRIGKRLGIRATKNPDLSDTPLLASFYEFWCAKRLGNSIPHRAAIDPLELKAHLGNLLILEPTDDHTDYRYRLVGTNITTVNGRDYTGWTVRQVFAPSGEREAELAVRAYHLVANQHIPVRVQGGVLWARKEYIMFDSILLPILSLERNESWVVAKLVFVDTEQAEMSTARPIPPGGKALA